MSLIVESKNKEFFRFSNCRQQNEWLVNQADAYKYMQAELFDPRKKEGLLEYCFFVYVSWTEIKQYASEKGKIHR